MASQENVVLPNQHLEDVVAWLQQMIKSGENILDLLQGLQDGEGREIEKIQLPIESLNIFRAPLSHTNIIMNEKSKQSEAFGVKLPRGIKVLKEPCIQIEDENNTQEENKDAQINDIETITMLFCTHCDFKTTYENQLSKHEIKRHDMLRQCDECDYKTCSKKVFEKHKLKQHGKPLECDKCAFQTNVPKQFRGHQLYKHGKRDYLCDQCDKKFLLPYMLNCHIESVHNGSTLDCPTCSHKTSTQHNLKRHMAAHHSKKNLLCTQCPFKTSLGSKLKYHIQQKHTAREDWPKCTECEYSSFQTHNVKQHYQTVHTKARITCNICSNSFTQIGNMQAHMQKIHKDLVIVNDVKKTRALFTERYTFRKGTESINNLEETML